jgi:hypothetical protein
MAASPRPGADYCTGLRGSDLEVETDARPDSVERDTVYVDVRAPRSRRTLDCRAGTAL